MKVLILGGTKFLGRALVDAALLKGHEVTLFNRGQTNPDIYPGTLFLFDDIIPKSGYYLCRITWLYRTYNILLQG